MSETSPLTFIKRALAHKFEILSEVGKGANAVVYKAKDKQNRIIALKVIHSNLVFDQESLERFKREANVGNKINHNNIVKIFEVGEVSNIHYMAMEFLDGLDLFRIIHPIDSPKRPKIISPELAIKYITPIAFALDHAHSQDIIHRDVKGANIIITKQGRSVLTDFGIAHTTGGTKLTMAGTIMGTVEYMSPEQANGDILDNRADLYSLGVVLYECVTGTVPYKTENNNPVVTCNKIVHEPLTPAKRYNSNIPDWLNSVLNKILNKNRDNRFNSGVEFITALNSRKVIIPPPVIPPPDYKTIKFETRKTKELQPITPPPRITQSSKRRKLKLNPSFAVLSAAAVLLIILFTFLWSRNSNSNEEGTNQQTPGKSETVIEIKTPPAQTEQKPSTENQQKPEQTPPSATPEKQKQPPINEQPKTVKVTVPNVVGRQLSVAQAVIAAKGLNVGSVIETESSNNKGIVLRQIPPAGVEVAPGSSINLVINK